MRSEKSWKTRRPISGKRERVMRKKKRKSKRRRRRRKGRRKRSKLISTLAMPTTT